LKTCNNKGFSLIELMVAMAITTIVIASVFTSYSGQQESNLSQKQVVEMQQHSRAAMYIMAMEIRMAGYDPDEVGGADIINAGDGSDSTEKLVFTYYNEDAGSDGSDNDNDGSTDEAGENMQQVEYYLYDSSNDADNLVDDLGRRNGARLDVIAENIQNLTFTYLDVDGAQTAVISQIKAIQIDITAKVDDDTTDHTTQNATRTVSTIVQCRNMNLE
jgi:type IV pilus assembly protein PilW